MNIDQIRQQIFVEYLQIYLDNISFPFSSVLCTDGLWLIFPINNFIDRSSFGKRLVLTWYCTIIDYYDYIY